MGKEIYRKAQYNYKNNKINIKFVSGYSDSLKLEGSTNHKNVGDTYQYISSEDDEEKVLRKMKRVWETLENRIDDREERFSKIDNAFQWLNEEKNAKTKSTLLDKMMP